jgi:hypothetical protein
LWTNALGVYCGCGPLTYWGGVHVEALDVDASVRLSAAISSNESLPCATVIRSSSLYERPIRVVDPDFGAVPKSRTDTRDGYDDGARRSLRFMGSQSGAAEHGNAAADDESQTRWAGIGG